MLLFQSRFVLRLLRNTLCDPDLAHCSKMLLWDIGQYEHPLTMTAGMANHVQPSPNPKSELISNKVVAVLPFVMKWMPR